MIHSEDTVQRNWRGHAARLTYFFNEGGVSLMQFKQALYAAAAIKILLDLSVLMAVVLTPVIFIAQAAWGWFWVRHGWFQHLQEVATIDAVAPINMVSWHMTVRLWHKLGLSMDGIDVTTMPQEIKHLLASFRKP